MMGTFFISTTSSCRSNKGCPTMEPADLNKSNQKSNSGLFPTDFGKSKKKKKKKKSEPRVGY